MARPNGVSVPVSVALISGVSRFGRYQLSASDSTWSPHTSCTRRYTTGSAVSVISSSCRCWSVSATSPGTRLATILAVGASP